MALWERRGLVQKPSLPLSLPKLNVVSQVEKTKPLWERRAAVGKRGRPTGLSLTLPTVVAHKEEDRLAKEFAIHEALGHGTTASVQKATRLSDGHVVALKTMRSADEEMMSLVKQEFDMLRRVEHPNIISAHDFIMLPGRAVLVMDFFDGSDLRETVASLPGGRMPEAVARPLIAKLADAVAHLHERRIVHRDIKPENILISKDLTDLRLVDFNVACDLKEGGSLTPTGDRFYAAPEVLLGDSPSELSDVWGVGLCAHLLLSGELPQGRSNARSVEACAERKVSLTNESWDNVSEACKAVLRQVLALRPVDRPLLKWLVEDAWLQGAKSAPEQPSQVPGLSRSRSLNFSQRGAFLVEANTPVGSSKIRASLPDKKLGMSVNSFQLKATATAPASLNRHPSLESLSTFCNEQDSESEDVDLFFWDDSR